MPTHATGGSGSAPLPRRISSRALAFLLFAVFLGNERKCEAFFFRFCFRLEGGGMGFFCFIYFLFMLKRHRKRTKNIKHMQHMKHTTRNTLNTQHTTHFPGSRTASLHLSPTKQTHIHTHTQHTHTHTHTNTCDSLCVHGFCSFGLEVCL